MFKAMYFIDFPSLLCIILINFSILVATGLLKHFCKSFSYIAKRTHSIPVKDLKKALEAVKMVMRLILYSGLLVSLFQWVIILRSLTVPESLGINLSVSILVMMYSLFFEILLLPVSIRLKLMLAEAND